VHRAGVPEVAEEHAAVQTRQESRSALQEVERMKEETCRFKIMSCLIKEQEPLILNHIAKKTHLTAPTVKYQIESMIADGLVLKIPPEGNGGSKYSPQQYFVNNSTMTSLMLLFQPYCNMLQKFSNMEQATIDNPIPQLKMLLELFMSNISEIELIRKQLLQKGSSGHSS
jgi:predicted transcriptional regulator